jgi:hypothetical protein
METPEEKICRLRAELLQAEDELNRIEKKQKISENELSKESSQE